MSNTTDLQAHGTAHQGATAGSIAAVAHRDAAALALVKFLRVDSGLSHAVVATLLKAAEQVLEYNGGGL